MEGLIELISEAALPALASMLETCVLETGRLYAAHALGTLARTSFHQQVADAALPGLLALAQVRPQCPASNARLTI